MRMYDDISWYSFVMYKEIVNFSIDIWRCEKNKKKNDFVVC